MSKNNVNMPSFITKYEVKEVKEHTEPTDMVDRSGYIPVSLQYARMMAAGRTKEDMRSYEYSADYYDLSKALEEKKITIDDILKNQTFGHNMEKTELVDALRVKMDKFTDYRDEYNRLMDEFYKSEKEKAIRQDAINAYKEGLSATEPNADS